MKISHKIKHVDEHVKIKIKYNDNVYKIKYHNDIINCVKPYDEMASNIIYDMDVLYEDSPVLHNYVIDTVLPELYSGETVSETDIIQPEKPVVTITIATSRGLGKTSISEFIEDKLSGFFNEIENTDPDTNTLFPNENMLGKLRSLSDRVKIVINTINVLKETK